MTMDTLGTISDILTITHSSGTSFRLRTPSFAEWHSLATRHQALGGKAPEAALIADTIATCLVGDDDKPVGDAAKAVLKSNPRLVMWLYQQCWKTVLRSDEETVKEIEKN